jgi:MHS family proline/betaine transporter-like MFS transporter
MATQVQTIPRPEPSILRRAVAGASIGSFVEFYDYAIYGYLAATLGALFFPSENPTASLLSSFAVFAVAFFVRPLGGVISGYFGDKIGRQLTLAVLSLAMAGCTTAIGLLPTYASIGIAAPILLLLLRLMQGFSAGGEIIGAMSFVAEYSPEGRRGFLTSWVQFASISGLVVGSVLATLLAFNLSAASMSSWGWRIPFLVAAPLGIIGLYIRLRLEDTPKFQALVRAREVAENPLGETLSKGEHYREMAQTVGIAIVNGVPYFILLTYMPTYLSQVVGFPMSDAFLSLTIAMVILLAAIPFMATLSDRVGRKPMLIGACIGFLVLSYPCFLLISQGRFLSAMVGQIILGVTLASYAGVTHATLTELFATRIRFSGYAISYNLSTAVFGGTAPLLMTYLIGSLGSIFAPAFYIMVAALLSLVTVLTIRETAKVPLRDV